MRRSTELVKNDWYCLIVSLTVCCDIFCGARLSSPTFPGNSITCLSKSDGFSACKKNS